MNTEILQIVEQMKDAWEGEPWFGRSGTQLLTEIPEAMAFEKPNGQHSILELVWHMVNWKEFAINRLQQDAAKTLHQFEADDWRPLDPYDKSLWQQGMNRLRQAQQQLLAVVQQQQDAVLDTPVFERNYSYKKLLYGVLQHDIYHLGQIAYISKLLKNK